MESGEGEVRSERDMEEAGRRARAWMNFCMGRTEITAIEMHSGIRTRACCSQCRYYIYYNTGHLIACVQHSPPVVKAPLQ